MNETEQIQCLEGKAPHLIESEMIAPQNPKTLAFKDLELISSGQHIPKFSFRRKINFFFPLKFLRKAKEMRVREGNTQKRSSGICDALSSTLIITGLYSPILTSKSSHL